MDIISKQLQAYSNRDLSTFLSCYHSDIKVYMLQSGDILADGKEELEQVMSSAFEDQNENSSTEVLTQIKQGNLIVNHEKIIGHTPNKIVFTISIYELKDGLISKLWFGGRTTEDG